MSILPFLRRFALSGLLGILPAGLLSCRAAEPYPEVIPIGEVQGEAPLEGEARRFRSYLLKETVRVQGVVHQILRWDSGSGANYALLIQNRPEDSDRDPATSDGLYLYTGKAPSLPLAAGGEHAPGIGELLTVRGTVQERYGQTELADAVVLSVAPGLHLDRIKVREIARLPDRMSDRDWILEAVEGMRVRVPSGAVTVSGTHPHSRMGDRQLWVVPPGHPVAGREDPSERRLYRPAHPMSHLRDIEGTEHGNHWVIGQIGAAETVEDPDGSAMPMVHAGSVIRTPLAGGVIYTWGEYVLLPDRLPDIEDAGASASSPPEEPSRGSGGEDSEAPGVRVAAYNVENLYDFRNDPFDGCDFAGDEGCPDVRKPFNYVPVSDERYRARLRAIARQIVDQMDSPDILLIQEVEDQDIGRLENGGMVYRSRDNADGKPDALQELALEIVAMGGPVYHTAVDRDGADYRGITCAWMYRPKTVRPAPRERWHPLLTEGAPLPAGIEWLPLSRDASNPKAFNAVFDGSLDDEPSMTTVFSRDVQLMQFEAHATGETLYLFNNHFSSGPDRRVRRRTMQARVNALLAARILLDLPGARVVAGGDLNVFPRPDDPLDPPSDQLAPLYDAGLFNVYDRILEERPADAYSYIYKGVVNTLDHFFLSPAAREACVFAAYLKLNAAAPESFPWDPPLRASDHDPLLIEFR